MAITVLTNVPGLIGTEDLRRVTVELGGVMKRLQTGLRVNSAADDVGALIQSHVLTRAISTLEVAIQQLETTDSTLLHIENSIVKIHELLTKIRDAAVEATDPTADRLNLQASINQWYLDIRNLVRTTIFKQTQLLRGGMGNKIIAPASILITNLAGNTRDFLSVGNIDVSGINLAGYASGALADTTVPNLVTVIGNGVAGAMFTNSVALNSLAEIFLTMTGAGVTAALVVGGNRVFTEVITVTFTGAQVLDFKNLGLRIFVDNARFGPAATIDAVITIRRELPKVFRGVDAGSEADYFRFDIPNLEPENLLGPSSLGGGTLFTFNIETGEAERAIQMIDTALKHLERVRNQIGTTLNLIRAAKDQAHDQRLQAQIQRSAIIETRFDEDAVRLASLQVIQQSATAMIAISRLTPQLMLQLFGGGG
jgi:flagellin